MSTNKLPEWPEELPQPCGLGDVISYYKGAYDAALARMEALVEYAREVTCENVHHKYRDYHEAGEPCPVMIRLHALLASCERRSEEC